MKSLSDIREDAEIETRSTFKIKIIIILCSINGIIDE